MVLKGRLRQIADIYVHVRVFVNGSRFAGTHGAGSCVSEAPDFEREMSRCLCSSV